MSHPESTRQRPSGGERERVWCSGHLLLQQRFQVGRVSSDKVYHRRTLV